MMETQWNNCTDRQPEKDGEYEILNNSGCNNGEGICFYDIEKGWDIMKPFKVLKWGEITNTVPIVKDKNYYQSF